MTQYRKNHILESATVMNSVVYTYKGTNVVRLNSEEWNGLDTYSGYAAQEDRQNLVRKRYILVNL